MENEKRKIISVKDLDVKFNVRSRILTAIRHISLDIYSGEVIAIVGESGSGKSVFTKTFSGMLDSNGFISNGSIIYNDDELAKTDVKLTAIKVKVYNKILDELKKYSKMEFGAEIYHQQLELKKNYQATFGLPKEVTAEYDTKIKALEFDIVEAYNRLQNLHEKEHQAEKESVSAKRNDLLKQKKALIAEMKEKAKACKVAAKANSAAQAEYQQKMAELEEQRKKIMDQRVPGNIKDRNARIAKEIYLSINRYPLWVRLRYLYIIMKGLKKAMINGVNLNDVNNLNAIFDKATFRVDFRYAEGEIYAELSAEQTAQAVEETKKILAEAKLENLFDFIEKQAKNLKVNAIYMVKLATRYASTVKEKELTEKRINNISNRTFREETIKAGTVLHGYTIIDLTKIKYAKDWQKIRGARISTVFQDPMTSLNPIRPIGKQITEVIVKHNHASASAAKAEAISLMEKVGITDAAARFNDYPFQYSGGMRQRIVIAIALASKPEVLICDEPTTALDVTIQAQIIDLIKNLQKELGFTTIYITHDLGVVASVAERVVVLYAGQIIEYGKVDEIFYNPKHPYTWALLSSLPQLSTKGSNLFTIKGTPPSLYNVIVGDAFAERNPYALEIDFVEEPPMFKVSDTHFAKTWLLDPRAPKIEPPEIIRDIHTKMANR